jgi:hypothetical protein
MNRMHLGDVLAILTVVFLWFGVFGSLIVAAFGPTLDQDAKTSRVPSRRHYIARIGPRLNVALPVFWTAAGLAVGLLATHPLHVAVALILVRALVFWIGGGRHTSFRAFAIHVAQLAAAAVVAVALRTFLFR